MLPAARIRGAVWSYRPYAASIVRRRAGVLPRTGRAGRLRNRQVGMHAASSPEADNSKKRRRLCRRRCHVRDDAGDVVRAARLVGQGDQALHHVRWR